jgi:ABC-type transport system involved in multi-copper enzyme maturation permease subunit
VISRRWVLRLFSGAVLLPVALAVLFLVRLLLAALGDAEGANWLERVGVLLLLVWGVDLIALLLAVSARHLFLNDEKMGDAE